jgi:hypothetical protein
MARERVVQVTWMGARGVVSNGARDGGGGEGQGAAADKRMVGEGARTDERPRYGGCRIDKQMSEWGFFLFLREIGPTPAEPRPDESHG